MIGRSHSFSKIAAISLASVFGGCVTPSNPNDPSRGADSPIVIRPNGGVRGCSVCAFTIGPSLSYYYADTTNVGDTVGLGTSTQIDSVEVVLNATQKNTYVVHSTYSAATSPETPPHVLHRQMQIKPGTPTHTIGTSVYDVVFILKTPGSANQARQCAQIVGPDGPISVTNPNCPQ